VAVVGAGPAGLFATIEIGRRQPDLTVCLVDQGPGLVARRDGQAGAATPWSGFGGAGFFIGGRLALNPDSLSSAPVNIDRTDAVGIRRYVESLLLDWNAGGAVLERAPLALAEASIQAERFGLTWHLNYPARHLSAEERLRALDRISNELQHSGVQVIPETTVSRMEPYPGGWLLVLEPEGQLEAESVILAPGRSGASWLARTLESAGASIQARTSVGVRIETLSSVCVPLTDLTPDPRLSMETPTGRFRTYACAKGSYVQVVDLDGAARISLRPGGDRPSPNTSFSLLWEPPTPEAIPVGVGPSASRLAVASEHFRERVSAHPPEPTLHLGISESRPKWPDEFWLGLADFLLRLEGLAPGIGNGDNLMYSPAVERYWEFAVAADGGIDLPGVHLAGDGAGLSQGAMAAAVSGVVAGRAVG